MWFENYCGIINLAWFTKTWSVGIQEWVVHSERFIEPIFSLNNESYVPLPIFNINVMEIAFNVISVLTG